MSDEKINHPKHYGGEGVYEVIAVLEQWNLGFHLGNVVKYIARAGKKDGATELEDLKKAAWYLDRRIKLLEGTGPSLRCGSLISLAVVGVVQCELLLGHSGKHHSGAYNSEWTDDEANRCDIYDADQLRSGSEVKCRLPFGHTGDHVFPKAKSRQLCDSTFNPGPGKAIVQCTRPLAGHSGRTHQGGGYQW